jgi:FtsP/CotA-like multicopper oxidase with cupredoxin domain
MISALSLKGLVPSLLFLGLASATPLAEYPQPRASTCNTPSNRACWQDGFDIHTDYELSTPSGTTRSYEWDVTEEYDWIGPDGHVKAYVQLVNGQFPGPTVFADWGDTITIKINNKLPNNG